MTQPARILRIHICEADRHDGKPLHQAILAACRDMRIAGATVFRGIEGFGETGGMHRRHIVGHDLPMTVVIVDAPENIERLCPVIEHMLHTGVMALSDAAMIRVRKEDRGIQ